MKKKKFSGKLNLNKITISKLEASGIKGGEMTAGYPYPCNTNEYTGCETNDCGTAGCGTNDCGTNGCGTGFTCGGGTCTPTHFPCRLK